LGNIEKGRFIWRAIERQAMSFSFRFIVRLSTSKEDATRNAYPILDLKRPSMLSIVAIECEAAKNRPNLSYRSEQNLRRESLPRSLYRTS
jgi:hypothetical protein